MVDEKPFGMEGFFFWFILLIFFRFSEEIYRNGRSLWLTFIGLIGRNLYVKVIPNLYKTDVLLKLRTKVINQQPSGFQMMGTLSEEGRIGMER